MRLLYFHHYPFKTERLMLPPDFSKFNEISISIDAQRSVLNLLLYLCGERSTRMFAEPRAGARSTLQQLWQYPIITSSKSGIGNW